MLCVAIFAVSSIEIEMFSLPSIGINWEQLCSRETSERPYRFRQHPIWHLQKQPGGLTADASFGVNQHHDPESGSSPENSKPSRPDEWHNSTVPA